MRVAATAKADRVGKAIRLGIDAHLERGRRRLALTPALSPGERGRRSRRLWKPTRPGVGAASERKGSNATDATEAIELSNSARQFSLSPGA